MKLSVSLEPKTFRSLGGSAYCCATEITLMCGQECSCARRIRYLFSPNFLKIFTEVVYNLFRDVMSINFSSSSFPCLFLSFLLRLSLPFSSFLLPISPLSHPQVVKYVSVLAEPDTCLLPGRYGWCHRGCTLFPFLQEPRLAARHRGRSVSRCIDYWTDLWSFTVECTCN